MTKRIPIQELKPGMVTATPVITPSGQLIINKGIQLDARLIDRIDFYSIQFAEVEMPDKEVQEPAPQEPITVPDPIPEPSVDSPQKTDNAPQPSKLISPSQKMNISPKFQKFQFDYNLRIVQFKHELNEFLNSEDMDSNALVQGVVSLLNDSQLTILEMFDMLHNMRQVDDSVYAHSLNVSLIARVLGKWLKWEREDIDVLTLAGLLHDIGKTEIPSRILNKPGKLTAEEFAIVKMHPRFGYDMIKNYNLDERVKNAVLCHHERGDGSGYPSGLLQNELDDFTMIIAIADVYDAMTAARSYRGPLCPFQVIESFEKEGLQKYNPQIILTFLSHIANAYQNTRVLLSDGRSATVVMLNNQRLSRPIVKFEDDSFLDLSTAGELHIASVI